MKIVNPIGKSPLVDEFSIITPRACICNSGSKSVLSNFGYAPNCACQCKDVSYNNSANHDMAYSYEH